MARRTTQSEQLKEEYEVRMTGRKVNEEWTCKLMQQKNGDEPDEG